MFLKDWLSTFRDRLSPPYRQRRRERLSGGSTEALESRVMLAGAIGEVTSFSKISDTVGNFTAALQDKDSLGSSLAQLGDLDGDGIADVAVGAYGDSSNGDYRGAVYVLFLNADGTVKSHQKINDTDGGFTGVLDDGDLFGMSLASLGDFDGDGVTDLAVGAHRDDDGDFNRGAVYLLFMNTDGTVKSHQKISDTAGNFTATLNNRDNFGTSVTSLGDLDGDGITDLAVGARYDGGPGMFRGAAYILFLNADGTVKSYQKINNTEGGFTGALEVGDRFGISAMNLGDLDGDGVTDLAVGAHWDDDGGYHHGAVYVLFLNTDGTVKSHQKISDTEGNFTASLDDADRFGNSLANLGDLDGDGISDLVVGAFTDDDGGSGSGATYVLFMNPNGTVKSFQKISQTQGNFTGTLSSHDIFGSSLTNLGDLDGDGLTELAVGALGDDDGGSEHGAVYILSLDQITPPGVVTSFSKISDTEGNFTGILDDGDLFGWSMGSIGDLDGDGVSDMVVSVDSDDDGGSNRGAVYVLFLNADGTVKSHQKISDTAGNFTATLEDDDTFGTSVTSVGDLDGDSIVDLVIGAGGDDDGGSVRGAVYILFMNSDGTVKAHQKISDTQGGFTAVLDDADRFGWSVANLGDMDGDGVVDLAVGARGDDDGGSSRGAAYILFLNSNGTVKAHQKISDTQGNFTATLDDGDLFGWSLAGLGDLDGDGTTDLAVGLRNDDDGGMNTDRGAVNVLFLNTDGTVKSHQKISDTEGSFTALLDEDDHFGNSLTNLGDIDGDGITDLAVGAYKDDDGGTGHGAVYVLFLNADGTVKSHQKISDTQGNFTATLDDNDFFGTSVVNLGDLDGDGIVELAVGAMEDDDGGGAYSDRGAVYVVSLKKVFPRDVIYVNDDFIQPDGTFLTDADPNAPGDQMAFIGMNAFSTIQAAIAAVGVDGEILITDDLSTDGPGLYAENLVIDSNLTIRATEGDPSAVVIDGGSLSSVISVDAATVTLDTLTIQHGAATNGGGIFNDGGTLTVIGSVVVDNTATRGGGVYSSGAAKTYIDDTSINGNTASDSGGGIWNSSEGLLVIRNGAAINNNTASGDDATQGGGGVFNNGGRLAVFDATISHNAAEGTSGIGGGVLSTDGIVTFEGATVAMNQANRSGGGIEFLTGLLQLTDTDLDGNEAGPAGSANPGSGGGLHVGGVNGRVTITNSRVTNNTAASEGGGLWNQNGNIMVIRDGSMIVGNTASGDAADAGGGGIYNDAGRLAIHSGVTISNNSADGVEGSGGGIFVGNGAVTIQDSTVSGNMANRAGGGIEVVTGFVELRETQVDNNIAGPSGMDNPGNGGGLHITGRVGQVGHIFLYGGTVSGNEAASEGGGIWNQGPTILVVRDGTVIDGNQASGDGADQGGGGIFNNSGRLALLNATISNNAADGDAGSGGGLFVASGGVTIEGGSMITHNTANRAGGGIEIQTGQVILVDSALNDNDAGLTGTATPGNGGGLHVSGTTGARIDLRNTRVSGNTAASEGGGLWHQTGNVMLVRDGSQVTGNNAAGDAADQGGGGIFNNGGRLVINGASIDGNSADGTAGSGGGLLLFNGVTTIEDSSISNNSANRAGGGIEIVNGLLITVEMTLTGNMAGVPGPANPGNGGGLHVTGATQVRTTIMGGSISNNTAAAQGGGLWNEAGSILVISDGTTISQNHASGASSNDGGGGLFNNGGRVAISSASIWGNMADGANGSGGGLFSTGGAVTLDNSTVSGNSANGDGGGIANSGELITANATIANNRSDADGVGGGTGGGTGGGIWNGGVVTLKNTIVAGNLVGGGITLSDLAGTNVQSNSRFNLISDASSSGGLVDGNLGNIIGNGGSGFLPISSILNPLADNGGPTLSHSLVSGSLAIDHGSNTAAADVNGTPFQRDQRGIGFPRIKNNTVDIGSIEN